jgi:hypothetical protein
MESQNDDDYPAKLEPSDFRKRTGRDLAKATDNIYFVKVSVDKHKNIHLRLYTKFA